MTFSALMSRRGWRRLAKGLCVLGGFLFFGSFIVLTVMQIYYIDHRPHTPQPELERTVPLPWTRPVSYGTAGDASKMFVVFSTGFYSIAIFAAGRAIRIYILDDDLPLRGARTRYGRLKRDPPEE
jgi:hypothetical protein